jgi:CRISPR-associated protein Csy1
MGDKLMPENNIERQEALRANILRFLSERLASKLEKLKEEDPKHVELTAQFKAPDWLEDASNRVRQIQAVTHSLKPIHPDARGSNLFCTPNELPPLAQVGSHCLGTNFELDVVGNAAALDVYKFLKLNHEGKSLLELSTELDADLSAALSADPTEAERWMTAFANLVEPRGNPASHTNAKQVYWMTGDDPCDDTHFHLLAPLYPTSLVHRIYQTLQDDRFSDDAKAARAARKAAEFHSRPVRDYQDLAIQKLGGTKPQNISQLNSERRGDNCLLASVPPIWESSGVRPLYGVTSLFRTFERRAEVRRQSRALRAFLESDPPSNRETRRNRDEWVNALIDELMQFRAELQTLPSGWSLAPECDLNTAHRQWLDPDETLSTNDELQNQIAEDFANWLNTQLRNPLPLGDPEFLYWRGLAADQLKDYERESA